MTIDGGNIRYATSSGGVTITTYTSSATMLYQGYSNSSSQINKNVYVCTGSTGVTSASPSVSSLTQGISKREDYAGYFSSSSAKTLIAVTSSYSYCGSKGIDNFLLTSTTGKVQHYYASSNGCQQYNSCTVNNTTTSMGIRPVITVNKK